MTTIHNPPHFEEVVTAGWDKCRDDRAIRQVPGDLAGDAGRDVSTVQFMERRTGSRAPSDEDWAVETGGMILTWNPLLLLRRKEPDSGTFGVDAFGVDATVFGVAARQYTEMA